MKPFEVRKAWGCWLVVRYHPGYVGSIRCRSFAEAIEILNGLLTAELRFYGPSPCSPD